MNQLRTIKFKVFDYHEELDCFTVNKKFKDVTDELLISEWTEVVWIGRFFALDNDYGEHWFDNWPERESLADKMALIGARDETELFVIDPDRFKNDKDGPCHTSEERKDFWRDVLCCLEISLATMINERRKLSLEGNEELTSEEAEQLITETIQKYS